MRHGIPEEGFAMKNIPEEYVPRDVHPITHDAFIRGEVSSIQDFDRYESFPPMAPRRALYEWDDLADTMVYVRDHTNTEMEELQKAHSKALAEWHASGGIVFVTGGRRVEGKFFTDNGDSVEGQWDGSRWVWAEARKVDQ